MLIALIAFFSYFLESIFGFGGTILFVGIGGIFQNFTEVLFIGVYVSAIASGTIMFQQRREIPYHHLKQLLILFAPGLVIGTFLIDAIAGQYLLKIFAVFIIAYGLQNIFYPKLHLPQAIKTGFILAGGFIQGLFSCGGPFMLMGYKDKFQNKSELRITVAILFFVTNTWKIIQNAATTGTAIPVISAYWWLAFPVIASMYAGYIVHKKISEEHFKIGMTIGITLIGFFLLLR